MSDAATDAFQYFIELHDWGPLVVRSTHLTATVPSRLPDWRGGVKKTRFPRDEMTYRFTLRAVVVGGSCRAPQSSGTWGHVRGP